MQRRACSLRSSATKPDGSVCTVPFPSHSAARARHGDAVCIRSRTDRRRRKATAAVPPACFASAPPSAIEPAITSDARLRDESSASDFCIDVSGSPLYNRIVDANVVGQAAVAGSTEPMRLDLHANGDVRYKLGFVIEHNPDAAPQGGSCIFAHLWRTAGEPRRAARRWMRPHASAARVAAARPRPVFVLLPQAEYARRESAWGLPDL